jgi:hypothetical protein
MSATDNYNHQVSVNPAEIIGHLSDIRTSLEAIALALEGIRHALSPPRDEPVGTPADEPVTTHTPIYTRRGTMTSPEFESWFGGSR